MRWQLHRVLLVSIIAWKTLKHAVAKIDRVLSLPERMGGWISNLKPRKEIQRSALPRPCADNPDTHPSFVIWTWDDMDLLFDATTCTPAARLHVRSLSLMCVICQKMSDCSVRLYCNYIWNFLCSQTAVNGNNSVLKNQSLLTSCKIPDAYAQTAGGIVTTRCWWQRLRVQNPGWCIMKSGHHAVLNYGQYFTI